MSDLGGRFRASVDAEHEGPARAVFLSRILDDGLRELRGDRWATSERSLGALGTPLLRSSSPHQETVIVEMDRALLLVTTGSGYVYAEAAADDEATADSALARLRLILPAPEPVARHDVPVTFWTYTPQGPMPSVRAIAVPEWPEIGENYAAKTRAQLDAGRDVGRVADDARVPRLLSRRLPPHPEVDDEEDGDSPARKHWRLLVLEDTGELLTPDAKSIIGQGLSRFLNVVDGLIGQGLRVLVLVTSNEELRRLHPAVARPGRCAANIEFEPLSEEEAETWLRTRGAAPDRPGRRIVASLYAQLEGSDESSATRFGFAE